MLPTHLLTNTILFDVSVEKIDISDTQAIRYKLTVIIIKRFTYLSSNKPNSLSLLYTNLYQKYSSA